MYDPSIRSKYTWRLWFYNAKLEKEASKYKERLVQKGEEVNTVGEIEDLTITEYDVLTPDVPHLTIDTQYCFFKKEIAPWWENIGNYNGGRILILFKSHLKCDDFYQFWEILLIRLIEGFFEEMTENICGAKFKWNPPTQNQFSIWTTETVTKSQSSQERIIMLVDKFFETFDEPDAKEYDISYQEHRQRNGYEEHLSERLDD